MVQQAEPSSQFVYCAEPQVQHHHQEYFCASPPPIIQSQPQFICMENPTTQTTTQTIQPTMINQIPVFNAGTHSMMTTIPQSSLQHATSVVLPQQVIQSAPAPAQFIQVSSPSQPQMIQTVQAPLLQSRIEKFLFIFDFRFVY